MAKRMLIDANHPEETRVAVLSGNRLEDYDHESATRKPLKGNIYLAKVTRVEPSLQAAFVDYGGNRHGFLPFSEIHPDYYRIPIADREALIAEETSLKGAVAEEHDDGEQEDGEQEDGDPEDAENAKGTQGGAEAEAAPESAAASEAAEAGPADDGGDDNGAPEIKAPPATVDTVGGDEVEDAARRRAKLMRRYKIQEVIKRRQVILVQVTKEERGNKGAALTTYLSLAGRYCVLMPNTGRGGGISRKIGSAKDRRRLKSVLEELDIPEGVSVIVRTAGSERTKAEIRRDYEYLLRLWNEIRETTLASTAPALIHEEASLITRSIRDLYHNDMDEILVEGDEGYKTAKAFMKSLIPSHARKVKQYKDAEVPLFYRFQVEGQIDGMHTPSVQLKSGGYIVINMTEALVAIDVNSGKATRERNIEETAYRTNLEAADEVARQVRLRDLAGLIVIDFIDMEESRHNRNVERRLKEAMRNDRARIQLGRISPFGLLELSRQRLRPSLFESSTVVCPHCSASGYVRTTQSVALHVLRGLEEEGIRRGGGEVEVRVRSQVALYILNDMRSRLVEIEQRYGFRVAVNADDSLLEADYRLNRISQTDKGAAAEAEAEAPEPEERRRGRGRRRRRKGEEDVEEAAAPIEQRSEGEEEEDSEAAPERAAGEEQDESKARRRRRRGKRGGRRRRRERDAEAAETDAAGEAEDADGGAVSAAESTDEAAAEPTGDDEAAAEADRKPRRSRRSRRKKADEGRDAAAASQGPEPQAETTDEDGEAEAAPETPAKEEAAPKRRRQRRSAKKKAPAEKPREEDAATHAPAGADAESAAPARGNNGKSEATPAADSEPSASDLPETVPAPPAASDHEPKDETAGQPRRRGWWQRLAKM